MTPDEPFYPPIPTRIVEPIVSPETTAPTPAVESVCPECTVSGNEALSKMTERRNKSTKTTEPNPSSES
jgi:hypothetical protein